MAQTTTDLAQRVRTDQPEDDRSAQEIRRDIAEKRESISATVERLNDRVETALDWRTYVADYPFVALGAAGGLGFLVSRMFSKPPTTTDRIMDALMDGIDFLPLKRRAVGGAVKAAATAMVTKAVAEYVIEKLGGQAARTLNRSRRNEELSAESLALDKLV
jgi:ElaB/YqjD/DUF883 family membrane-anchored ribosome-binding protein